MSLHYVNNPEAAKEYLPRYKGIYFLIIFSFVLFIARLWFLQMVKGNELREFSEKNRLKEIKLMAPRGLIFDRDGKILVENLAAYDAVIIPQYVDDLESTVASLAQALHLDPDRTQAKVESKQKKLGRFAAIKIKENLGLDEVFRVLRLRLDYPGIEVRENVIRHYPLGPNGAQMLGYVSEISKKQLPELNKKYKDIFSFDQGDIIGKSGVEQLLDIELRGKDGFSFLQVDAHGREIANVDKKILGQQIKDIDATPGQNLQLTLDKDIQDTAYKSFYIDNQRIGAVVAMKTNGEILAWVSTPSFDPNEFSKGMAPDILKKLIDDPFKPFRNKVIQDHASPGSSFKPFVAISALQEKVVTPTTIVNVPAVFKYGNRPYHESVKGGFGNITIFEAIERSSNVFFYKMGITLGIDRIAKYASLLGLGSRTGIELIHEDPGLIPTTQWKKATLGEEWQGGENLSNAIGQGFVTVTPLQMAIAYNAIGLEGKVIKPFFVKKVIDPHGEVLRSQDQVLLRDLQTRQENGVIIDSSTFKTVKEAMRRVANGEHGTARFWKIPGVEMAGKTGTTQVASFSADQIYAACTSRPLFMRPHGWFVAFAPVENPEITVAVLAEHACHGNTGAAPIVRDVIQAYMQKYHPDWIENGIAQAKNKKAALHAKKKVEIPLSEEE